MLFEFDPRKSESNKAKHGIDFVEAQGLWEDAGRYIFPARSDDEPRYAMIAQGNTKHWVVFFTLRGENIRIISARRARDNERELYES